MPRVVIEGMSAEEVAELVRRLGGDVAITVTESAVGNEPAAKGRKLHPAASRRAGKVGRPPGLNREKRTINLNPSLWEWLESKRLPSESFNDTCNRILTLARSLLP